MIKKLSTVLLASILAACVSDGDENPPTNGGALSSNPSSALSSSSTASSSAPTSHKTGAQLYKAHNCAACHGDDAANPTQPIVFANWNQNSLAKRINDTMPHTIGLPTDCVGECADKVAEYVLSLAPVVACNEPAQALPQRLRLLTNREYANTINDLLGRTDGEELIKAIPVDTRIAGFDNNAKGSSATAGRVDAYWSVAQKIADTQSNINNLLGCGQQQQNPSQDDIRRCGDIFVPAFGKKAFRRPLNNEELTAYKAIFNAGNTTAEGFAYTLRAFLSSPSFLYRSEIGKANAGQYQLDNYELASLLSYTLWGSMPDETLLNAAKSGALSSANTLRQQAERLLKDPRAQAQFAHFGRQWLNVGNVSAEAKDTTIFSNYSVQIANHMETELDLFLQELFLGGNYKTADIYTANFTYLNRDLAQFYGINNTNTNDFQKVTVDNKRQGVLTKGAVLTINASSKENHPIKRGLLIRRNLLCQEFGLPPANVGEIEPLDPSKPLRERSSAHSNNPACAACHQHIDPLGFAFENYNGVGQYRTTEGNNLAIDATGSLIGIKSMADLDEHNFDDLQGLTDILANQGQAQVESCLATQYHRYYQGVAKPDICEVQNTVSRWQTQSGTLMDLWLAPLSDPNFMMRR
ncbi:DUF1592 domain-containing protein [Marinagarivorans algicola]|uniref:DUF1592 domain-containing protein n=1 Tax=Marinagarivorans algicola TaxID=1513270 RepID=UPI0006B4CDA4|nr:DUF1592 domain-containing protein [Marinagarivorans algicola]